MSALDKAWILLKDSARSREQLGLPPLESERAKLPPSDDVRFTGPLTSGEEPEETNKRGRFGQPYPLELPFMSPPKPKQPDDPAQQQLPKELTAGAQVGGDKDFRDPDSNRVKL
tara:strand:- start:984 stop:1325 length:342 start_codon:yes stop_codon:yes gene_type:complete